MDELICIVSPESRRCSENDGIPSCMKLISRNEWNDLVSKADSLNVICSSYDYSCGGHGCMIDIDFKDMIKNTRVIDNLSKDVIDFISKIENSKFIDMLKSAIEERYIEGDISIDDCPVSVSELYQLKHPPLVNNDGMYAECMAIKKNGDKCTHYAKIILEGEYLCGVHSKTRTTEYLNQFKVSRFIDDTEECPFGDINIDNFIDE